MSITRHLRQSVLAIALAGTPFSFAQQPATTRTAELTPAVAKEMPSRRTNVMAELRIESGPLSVAVEQLSQGLRASKIPEPNVIFSPETREIVVPDLTLRNVNGNDALRLITVSAGCDMEPIIGTDNDVVGFRVFTNAGDHGHGHAGVAGAMESGVPGLHPGGGRSFQHPPTVPRVDHGPGLPGMPAPGIGPSADLHSGAPAGHLTAVSSGPPGAGASPVIGFGMMPGNAANSVRVYSLGAITHTVKFTEVETTLRDILQAGGVSSDQAKIAFHDKTNVLVVNGSQQVHELATQFIDALQKNNAASTAENKRDASERRELVEMAVRLRAEEEQRAQLMQQLGKTESLLRDTQRELDRVKATTKQSQ